MRVTSGHRLQSSLRIWRDLIPPANQANSMESRFLFSPVICRLLFVLFLPFCSFIHGSLSHSISSFYLSLSVFFKNVVVVEYAISCGECGLSYVSPSICEVYGRYVKEGFLNWLLHVGGRRSTTDEQRNYGEVITKKLTLISSPLQRLLSGRLDPSQCDYSNLDTCSFFATDQ